MGGREDRSGRLVLWGGGLLLAYAVGRVLAPFLSVIAGAALAAVVGHPLHRRLRRRISNSASAVAVAACSCLLLAVPLSLGAWALARESLRAYPILRGSFEDAVSPAGQLPSWFPTLARDFLRDVNVRDVLIENIHEIGAWSGRAARSALSGGAALAAQISVFVLSLFLFLRDGDRALERLTAALPLAAETKDAIARRARDTIIAMAEGVFAVAVLQGVLSMAGFALFGVRFPVVLGALCMAFSPIPFVGSALVWIPVAVMTAAQGRTVQALLLAGWFALVVGVSDNLIRPILVGARARLPVALVVVGVLGGVKGFGALGVFLGPVIMALAVSVADALLP